MSSQTRDAAITRESALALIEDANRWQAAYNRACDLIAAYEGFDDVISALSDARHAQYAELQLLKERFRGK